MRQKLMTAIKKAFLKTGYSLLQGFIPLNGNNTVQLPALWLSPLRLAGKSGRTEGVMVYRVTLHLLSSAQALTQEMKEQKWTEFESLTTESITALFDDTDIEIVGLSEMQIIPTELNLTQSGEVGVQINFNIEVNYYDGNS